MNLSCFDQLEAHSERHGFTRLKRWTRSSPPLTHQIAWPKQRLAEHLMHYGHPRIRLGELARDAGHGRAILRGADISRSERSSAIAVAAPSVQPRPASCTSAPPGSEARKLGAFTTIEALAHTRALIHPTGSFVIERLNRYRRSAQARQSLAYRRRRAWRLDGRPADLCLAIDG